jgi:hypothetical protein
VRITRRHLQISLGLLWLLDGALQCQPFMFTRHFARQVLAPAGAGQPAALAGPMHFVESLVSAHPSPTNTGFALVQISLGLMLLTRRHSRAVLTASIGWALSVWIVGEGLGGLATGATLLTGAPGSALLYGAIAMLAWPAHDRQGDERPSWLALPMWCTLWLMGAGLQLIDGNNSSSSLTMMLRMSQSGAPTWIARIDQHLAHLSLPSWTSACLAAVYVLVAIWAVVPGWTRQLSIGIGIVISLAGWLLFQGLGDLTSGQATDPNTGPLLVLLALAVVGAYSHQPNPSTLRAYTPIEPEVSASLVSSSR